MGLFGGSLGSLFVKLGADTSGFRRSLKRAEGDLSYTSGRLNSFVKIMRTAVPAAAIVAGTAYIALVKKTAAWGDKLAKTAKQLNITTTFLSEMEYAANISGSTLSDLQNGIRRMSKAAADARDGMATYIRAFDRLGISVVDTNGKLKDGETLFLEVADRMSKLEDSTLKVATAQDLLGRGGARLIPLLDQGAAGIAKLRRRAEELGVSLDKTSAENMEEFVDAMTDLNAAFKGIAIGAAPYLKELARMMELSINPPAIGWRDFFIALRDAEYIAVGGTGAPPSLAGYLKQIQEANRLVADLRDVEDIEAYQADDLNKKYDERYKKTKQLTQTYGELSEATIKLNDVTASQVWLQSEVAHGLKGLARDTKEYSGELIIVTDETKQWFKEMSEKARYFADASTNALFDLYDGVRAGKGVFESLGNAITRFAEQAIYDILRVKLYSSFLNIFSGGQGQEVGNIIGSGVASGGYSLMKSAAPPSSVQIIDQRGGGAPDIETQSGKGPTGEEVLKVIIRDTMKAEHLSGRMRNVMGPVYGLNYSGGLRR